MQRPLDRQPRQDPCPSRGELSARIGHRSCDPARVLQRLRWPAAVVLVFAGLAAPWLLPPPHPNPDYVTYQWLWAWRAGAILLIATRVAALARNWAFVTAGGLLILASVVAASGQVFFYFD